MDETYIRMCDCSNIQGLWEPKKGDRYISMRAPEGDVLDFPTLFLGDTLGRIKHDMTWLPRQEDWQNILFSKHYAPAIPNTVRKIQAAMIIMHREFVDYMEAWKIDQPCEAWARLYMNRAHNKTWTEKGWA